MKITFQIDATVAELPELASRFATAIGRRVEVLSADAETDTLTIQSTYRYRYTGRIGNYGERAGIDTHTGRRGAYMAGFGFVAGAIVLSDGRVEFEHPYDNPFH